jgi:DNA-binding transcriptional LysR family regulator
MRESLPANAHVAASLSVSLHQLRLFVSLARHRSFTRVGDELGITQSAVSRAIRELEAEIELRLFDRTTRQVSLTDTGRQVLARLAPLVEELEAALRPRPDAQSEPGVVHLGSSSSLTASVLPALLASCRDDFPDLTVSLIDQPQNAVLQLVRSGEADLGVVIEPGNLDELVGEPLFDDALAAVVSPDHPFTRSGRATWQQLRGESLFLLDDDTGSLAAIERALGLHDVAGATRQRLTQAGAVAQMVQARLGIGIMPGHACTPVDGRLAVAVPLTPEVSRTVMLVRRRSRAFRAGAATLWAHFLSSRREARQAVAA